MTRTGFIGRRRPGSITMRTSLGITFVASLIYFFLIVPSLIVIPMSFGDTREFMFPPPRLSTYLYEIYFFEGDWMATTMQSFRVAALTTCAALVLGVTAAYGIVRGRLPGRQLLTVFLLTPMLVPLIVIALGLYMYFSLIGISGSTLSLVIAHTLYATPFVIILVMAALRQIDPNLEAAAILMGAGKLYVLRRVTLPLLSPALISSALFAFLISFDEVIMAIFLTGVRTKTLPVKMYDSIVWEISPVLAAISTLLTLIALVICVSIVIAQYRARPAHE